MHSTPKPPFGRAACAVERAAHIKDNLGLCRGKTDKLDSKRIALFAYKNRQGRLCGRCSFVVTTTSGYQSVRSTYRLTKAIKLLKTPLSNTEGFISKDDQKANLQACCQSLKALKADLKATDKSIAEVIESDAELKHLFERVTSIKGISQTTAVEVIIRTNEFKSITDPKKYAASAVRLLCGRCSL